MTIVAIDIGGTNTRIGLCPDPSSPVVQLLHTVATPVHYDDMLQMLRNVLASLPCDGIGISIGAQLRSDGQAVHAAPNLPDYERRLFLADLASLTTGPIRMAHDPVCGLLAEWRFGALAEATRMAYLTLSTGTGAATGIAQSEYIRMTSIQFGHQIFPGSNIPCLCGQIGCLETLTGGRQLEIRYGIPLSENHNDMVWDTMADALATGLVNLAHLARTEIVAVSGSIALNRPELLPDIQQRLDQRLHNTRLTLLPARTAALAPLIGAAQLCMIDCNDIVH